MDKVMETKVCQAQLCYEDLKERLKIETDQKVVFHLSEDQKKQLKKACFSKNPFPGVLKAVLLSLRLKAVNRLFLEEKVLQTGPAAAILALDAVLTEEIKALRDGTKNKSRYFDLETSFS